MDKTKQLTHQENNTGTTLAMYWGTIAIGLLGMVSVGIALATVLQFPRTTVIYFAIGLYILTIAGGIGVTILTIRGRQDLGARTSAYLVLLLFVTSSFVFTGRALTTSFSLVTISGIVIFQLLPKASRRRHLVIAGGTLILIWVLEWLNPSWRLQSELGRVGPATAIIFGIILAVILVRQAWGLLTYSISNRLTALVLVVTVPLLIGVTAYISNQAGSEIETQALHNLEQNHQSLSTNVSTWLELHVRSTKEMALLPDIISMDAARQKPTLLAIASTHPNLFLVHITGLNGINVARNDDAELNDYHDRAWFLGAISGAPITYEALISRTIGKPALNIAAPIYNSSGKIVGVASIVSELSEISKEVLSNEDGQGIIYIVDANNRVVAHPDPTYTENELRDLSTYPPIVALSEGKTGQITFTDENGVSWIAYVDRLDNGWGVVAQQPEAELLAPVRQFQTTASILIFIGSALMSALAWFAVRRNLQPIGTLTTTVSAIGAGDLNRIAEVKSQDEIGVLASTFNEMTAKLRESFATLEQRVAERTRNLELAAKVGRTVSQVRALDVMLKDAAELIRTQFDLYYVQVYLVNPSQTDLNLQAGTGSVGAELLERNHRLSLNAGSINGRAAIEKQSVVISDTASSPTFKPNPLLPNTRSEMAVPLLIGSKVVGVLDMQSEQAGSLNKDILPAFEALAGQLAIAIQNATFLAETEQARAEVEAQARRQTRNNWMDYLDAIHKPEETGFVFQQNKITQMTSADQSQTNVNAYTAPIAVTGEALGNLVVEMEDQSPISQIEELINTVARQVSQQIENLRLLDNAERFRFDAEQASRRLTSEGWKDYMDTSNESLSYIYDLKEVRPFHQAADQQADGAALSLPIKVRDEIVGKLVVQGVEADDSASLEIANVIAERLGAHIESLRLSRQTEQALATTQKQAEREQALRQITSAVRGSTDPTTILRSAARELGTLLGRKTIVRLTTAAEQFSQAHRPAELVGEAITSNGNESVSPAELPIVDGGKQ